MPTFSVSTGHLSVSGLANVPNPSRITGYDVYPYAAGGGEVTLYELSNSGTKLAGFNSTSFSSVELNVPVKVHYLWVELDNANTVVRYG